VFSLFFFFSTIIFFFSVFFFSVVAVHESNEKARYHVQRIGVMTKLPNEEGKSPAKNYFQTLKEGSSNNTHEEHLHSS
jgi:hypothetical protein